VRRRTRRADGSITARDFLWLLLLVMLLLINPPAKLDAGTNPPGNMIVSIAWPEGATDVDLWVRGPGEQKAVGYSNRGGTLFNLLRDDLGTANDAMPSNYENAYSRGLPAGRYVINAHCFTCSGPVRVSVEVRMNIDGGQPVLLYSGIIELRPGQERTAIQFRLTEARNVYGANNVYEPLREVK
jgi:hypothetical protein